MAIHHSNVMFIDQHLDLNEKSIGGLAVESKKIAIRLLIHEFFFSDGVYDDFICMI